MTIKSKLALLELISGLFGWGWMIAGAAALYFLVMAVGFDGGWSPFFWTLGASAVCKWLAKGFKDNQIRVAFEVEKIEQGLTPDEAAKAWLEAYNKESK